MLLNDLQKLSVDGVITLYMLDASRLGAGILRWHGHLGGDGRSNDIIWQGEAYSAISITSDGLEIRGDGAASTPTLTLANSIDGIPNAVSALCLQYDDFAGARLTVIKTLAKYLDAANFTDGSGSKEKPTDDSYTKQTWYIEQKTSEDEHYVVFELSNPVDLEGAVIPSRDITSYCHWCTHGRYRGEECGYMGSAMFTEDGEPTDNPELDKCGGRLKDCIIRFGENNPLRFGGFPASNLKV